MQTEQTSLNGAPSLLIHCDMREGLDGDAQTEPVESIIRVDDSLRGREYLETVIHEALHVQLPHASEEFVTRSAEELSQIIFSSTVRRRSGL